MTAMFTSCAIGPDYKRPDALVPAAFKEAQPLKDFIGPMQPEQDANFIGPRQPKQDNAPKELIKARPKDDAPKGKWWEVFNDAELNHLEEQVAVSNQTVKAAEASFHQARALVSQARSGYFPSIGLNASFTRSGTGQGAGSASGNTLGGVIRNRYSASLEASWVPDFWGRIRRQVEASKASAEASAADLASALLVAQGELAVDYFSLRVADAQKRLLESTVAAYAKSLQITENQYKLGVAAQSDVLQAKVQLQAAQTQVLDINVQRAQLEHAIAVLAGKAPADFSIAVIDNVPMVPEIPVGVPSQLLERRPDIASAERTVAAANAQIGVAEAAFFPDITLGASGGFASSELSKWFTLPSRFWSIGPTLVETLFDAGLRAAQTEAAIAVYDQAVANYRQTVLSAFQGVEDNLASLRILAEETQVLESTVRDARRATTISLNQYKAGTVSYLNVVSAQTAQLNNEIALLNVTKARLTSAATLIEDLGGGWNAEDLKKPDVAQGEATPFSLLPPSIKHTE